MKKVFALSLALVVLMSLFTAPVSASWNVNTQVPASVTGLSITTANRKRTLRIAWNQQPQADGYQVYRSTTGKSGSYKKIAILRGKSFYVDKDLKDAKTYYYAVRAFCQTNGQVSFGKFAKASLSTRITASYAKKRFNAAMKFFEDFYSSGTNFDQVIMKPHTYASGTYDAPHYLFEYKNCRTKEQLKKYLTKYVSGMVADTILKAKFYIINGKLYIWFPAMGAESGMVLSKTKITDCVYSDKKVSMQIGVFWQDFLGFSNPYYEYINQTLVYENGQWVFGKADYMTDWIYPYW